MSGANAQQQQQQQLTPRVVAHKSLTPRRYSNNFLCFVVATTALFANCIFIMNLLEYLDIGATGRLARTAGTKVRDKTLAVVVPAHGGDLARVMSSLSRWPTMCSSVTMDYVDLVLYFAQDPEHDDWSTGVMPILQRTGGRCFARTRVVFGHLTDQENFYPKGPSVQFYKMFLDVSVRSQFVDYDMLSVIEWDVLVMHDKSFEHLYHAAFAGTEPFWMKGSTLAGTTFHSTAAITDHWHVLGHINGNAIYNNKDPDFVDFVNFTRARWDYEYSYDVALWATIADFPYSWPLWQRYSGKFVNTNLIANVGLLDVDKRTVSNALSSSTMFIHGSVTGGGGAHFLPPKITNKSDKTVRETASEVQRECHADHCDGGYDETVASPGKSTVCDPTCVKVKGGARFDGLYCGAGDSARYGKHCRLCYTDEEEARKAEVVLASEAKSKGRAAEGQHVIMCDTMRPPQSANCNAKCATKTDTICDDRCGGGLFGDYNCNWRDRGPHCRFCFDDLEQAWAADEAAKRSGGRVVMCDTHDPPIGPRAWEESEAEEVLLELPETAVDVAGEEAMHEADAGGAPPSDRHDKLPRLTPATTQFAKNLVMGELCAFTAGYFVFFAETVATVNSVLHFMPGMRMVVSTDPTYFSVFNRTIGDLPGVKVVNSTTGSHASLMADHHCGDGTQLIYYMNPGEVLSRKFTSKDTHGTNGDLLVPFTEVQRVDDFHEKRTRATTAVLGFGSPSFSYGNDMILPAKLNRQLRHLLVTSVGANARKGGTDDELILSELHEEQLAAEIFLEFENIFVPEVLAALAYSQNPPGMWFLNPQQWVMHHMFQPVSVWNIPLVKPRFGCSTVLSLSPQGYDVAHELARFVHGDGGKCDSGFLDLDPSMVQPKPEVEFGGPRGDKPMPRIEGLRVSVVYTVEAADAWVFNATFPTVVNNFPGALEIVVVVDKKRDVSVFRGIVAGHEVLRVPATASTAAAAGVADPHVRVVWAGVDAEKRDSEGAVSDWTRKRFPLLWVDEYCAGNFVMHLDADSVLTETLTYDHVFHFRKPVLPFARFRDAAGPGETCWRSKASETMATSLPIGKTVVHDFSAYDTHVYPVGMYPMLRAHLLHSERVGSASLGEAMEGGKCEGGGLAATTSRVGTKRFQRVVQYSLMATFMWYRMHDSMHWRAIDPLDLQADEWFVDPLKYVWQCNLEVERPPQTEGAMRRFREDAKQVHSIDSCKALRTLWNAKHRD